MRTSPFVGTGVPHGLSLPGPPLKTQVQFDTPPKKQPGGDPEGQWATDFRAGLCEAADGVFDLSRSTYFPSYPEPFAHPHSDQ